MYAFEIEQPTSIAEAVQALQNDDTLPLSGGQTLIPTLKQRLAAPETLVSLSGIAEMKGLQVSDNKVIIGAGTSHAAVAEGAVGIYPALAKLAGQIGDPAVRTRGTLGGSLANNDPSACYPAAALGSGAVITTNARDIDADTYFQGLFETALEDGEIVTRATFPIPEKAHYQKFVQPASRFALVGVFVAKFADAVRVAVTGASENGVFRWRAAETALSEDFAPGALDGLSVAPDDLIGDLHGSKDYRAHLIGVMSKRAVQAAD